MIGKATTFSLYLIALSLAAACGARSGHGATTVGHESGAASPAASITPEQWHSFQQQGEAMVRMAGAKEKVLVERLRSSSGFAQHEYAVQGGYCYLVFVGWGSEATTYVSNTFVQAQPLVNERLGGTRDQFEAPLGLTRFCADNDGRTVMAVSPLNSSGAIDIQSQQDFLVVVGRHQESAGERELRVAQEEEIAAGVRERRAHYAAQAAAKEARRCRECKEKAFSCRVRKEIGLTRTSNGESCDLMEYTCREDIAKPSCDSSR